MYHSFEHVKIDALISVLGDSSLNVRECALKYGAEEKRVNRFININGFENLAVLSNRYSLGDMCLKACSSLLDSTNSLPSEIDAFVICSQTHDFFIPGTTFTLQEQLGLKKECLLYDLLQGCPGYINSLFLASSLIETGICKKIIVCNGEVSNHIPPASMPNVETFFETGDACSCTLLTYSSEQSELLFSIENHGELHSVVMDGTYGVRAGRINDEITSKPFSIQGDKMNVFVLDTVATHIQNFMSRAGIKFQDITKCISQQTGKTLLCALSSVLDVQDPQWMPFTAENTGNLSSASIPTVLSEAFHFKREVLSKTLLSGFGVGLSTGLLLADLSSTQIIPSQRML